MPINIITKNHKIIREQNRVTTILIDFLYLGVFANTIKIAEPEIKYGHKNTLNSNNDW